MAIGARVGGAGEGVSAVDDVVAEHAFALIDLPGYELGRAGHAHAQLAVVRHVQADVEGARQDGLVLVDFHLGQLVALLDHHFVGVHRSPEAAAAAAGPMRVEMWVELGGFGLLFV